MCVLSLDRCNVVRWLPFISASCVAIAQQPQWTATGEGLSADPTDPPPGVQCPLKMCGGTGIAPSVDSTTTTAWSSTTTPCPIPGLPAMPANPDPGAPFDVVFKPGHFVCTSCDTSSCEGCGIMCDVSSCIGSFYTQECWCEDKVNLLTSKTTHVMCDQDCTGGVCDQEGMQCRSKETACTPWWWCGLSPPSAFVQRQSSRLRQKRSQHEVSSALELRVPAPAPGPAPGPSPGPSPGGSRRPNPNLAFLHLQKGRFDCSTAAIPPKAWDKAAMQYMSRGYVVLDKATCSGGLFNVKCYCWDNFKYLSGMDPKTSELQCDSSCSWGGCEGKTCGATPPPPLPGQNMMALPPQGFKQGGEVKMVPMDEAAVTQ